MIWRILKRLLSTVSFTLNFTEGDKVQIKLVYGGHVILDRIFDIMPGT